MPPRTRSRGQPRCSTLETLTGPAKAFINTHGAALLRAAPRLLSAPRVVELLETILPTPEIDQVCKELSKFGYPIAIGDFTPHPKWEPILLLAKFLKMDFQPGDAESRRSIAEQFRSNGKHLFASLRCWVGAPFPQTKLSMRSCLMPSRNLNSLSHTSKRFSSRGRPSSTSCYAI